MERSLLELLFFVLIAIVFFWLVGKYEFKDAKDKRMVMLIAVTIFVVVFLLRFLFPYLRSGV